MTLAIRLRRTLPGFKLDVDITKPDGFKAALDSLLKN